MPPTFLSGSLALTSLLAVIVFYLATRDSGETLSPQGCRMSWMSPSYALQSDFNGSWTPLARRYSLWLYREVGWDYAQIGDSLPVVFIPGNAGSSHQVRSIASSATRQYFSSPLHVSPVFASRAGTIRPLDFYAVEFNEDLSAFHGTTLESQIQYTTQAISYILSLYPPNTKVIVLGHSMGGVVATSLLPSPDITTVITMATPYMLPPARFDSSIDPIYSNLWQILANDSTPIVSLCGGATDMMIPSESCILPPSTNGHFRRTVFTSSLEGAWTGVGHREMVWCHQVRWRVARAALELAPHKTESERSSVLDTWLRDGHILPAHIQEEKALTSADFEHATVLSIGEQLKLKNPDHSRTYLLPLPRRLSKGEQQLTLLVSQGSVHSVGPENPILLRISVYQCNDRQHCSPLQPNALKLIPNPIPNRPFPVPDEGSDESEGVVLFEADLKALPSEATSLALKVEHADGRGWIIAGFDQHNFINDSTSTSYLLFGGSFVQAPNPTAFSNVFVFPNLLSHVLLVYRAVPVGKVKPSCPAALLPPLIMHHSNPVETHYFPLADHDERRTLLHTHMPAPFIGGSWLTPRGVAFTVYSSGLSDCTHPVEGIKISIDWAATLARWATRYWMSIISWAIGAVTVAIFYSWDSNGQIPTVSVSLHRYGTLLVHRLLIASFLFSFLPLPRSYYLGNAGEGTFAIIAPLILVISSGLVVISWWLISTILCAIRKVTSLLHLYRNNKQPDVSSVSRHTLLSIALLFLTIFLFVPWQVAFLGCWVFHLYTCAAPVQASIAPSLPRRSGNDQMGNGRLQNVEQEKSHKINADRINNANFNLHLLLLMTWMLPLVAPILAVWVRTLATAGLTTPFNGDHNFLNVAPFLILVDFASRTPGQIFERVTFEKWLPARWLFAIAAATAFIVGSRNPYIIFHAITVVVAVTVCTKIGRRYWNGSSASRPCS